MEEHCSLPRFFPSSRSLPFTFCLPYKLSIYSLEGAEQFSSPSLFSWSSWGNMLWKELIIIWHSKLLLWVLISPSHSLSRHHFCFIFQSLSLSLSHSTPSHHLISSADEDWWRNFFLHHDVLSLLLCLTKRLITVLPLMLKVLFLWMKD